MRLITDESRLLLALAMSIEELVRIRADARHLCRQLVVRLEDINRQNEWAEEMRGKLDSCFARPESNWCHDCNAAMGELHESGCDNERCRNCGMQAITCECDEETREPRIPWDGEHSGAKEAKEFDWWTVGPPWSSCQAGTPGARPDVGKVVCAAAGMIPGYRWDRDLGRVVKCASA